MKTRIKEADKQIKDGDAAAIETRPNRNDIAAATAFPIKKRGLTNRIDR